MIQVDGISKRYGKRFAVDNLTFHVEKGHIYGLLGPNGAGKSTTMNIITGYLAPTSGTVTINGNVMGKDSSKAKKCIGYLPEIPPLYPDMYVKEYLNFAAGLKKIDKEGRDEEIDRVMNKCGIADVSGRLIKNLSKGYRQRIGIAQALLGSPEVIILDEPTVGLDPEQIIEVRDLIKSLKEEHTVILSSHILSEISAVCDDCLIIAQGKVIAIDTMENIIKMDEASKNQKLHLTVKGSKEEIEKVFKQIPVIESFDFVSETEDKCVFDITAVNDKDIKEDVSFALSDARLLILSMEEEKSSLENSYLSLVKKAKEEDEEISEEDLAEDEDNQENTENPKNDEKEDKE